MYFLKKYKRGIFNKYHKQMPAFEMFLKDLNHSFLSVKNYFGNNFKTKKLLVYPHYPSRGSTIYKIAKRLNYNISNKIGVNYIAAVYWEYLTFRKEFELLEGLSDKLNVVNLYSRNISKEFVDKTFHKVFSYSTFINPLEYKGKIVKKNDINAKHDGQILNAPTDKIEEGFIYQILIDNTVEDNKIEDIRVPVIGQVLDFVYLKYRNQDIRFTNSTEKTLVKPVGEILKQNEIEKLNLFCKELKLEYGELDVLRDKHTKKIYVVDVNNTPQGPPANTAKADAEFALDTIAKAFQKLISTRTETQN